MTSDADSPIDSEDALLSAIESALLEAHRNDVEVEGGWFIETDTERAPDWDVEIWPVDRTD